jgi:hypothetical protein
MKTGFFMHVRELENTKEKSRHWFTCGVTPQVLGSSQGKHPPTQGRESQGALISFWNSFTPRALPSVKITMQLCFCSFFLLQILKLWKNPPEHWGLFFSFSFFLKFFI